MDIYSWIAVIIAIVVKLVIIKGNFVLPTFYKTGNEVSFNLGSLANIIFALITALTLSMTDPASCANPAIAFTTSLGVPYLVEGVITYGARNNMDADDVTTVYSADGLEEVDENEEGVA